MLKKEKIAKSVAGVLVLCAISLFLTQVSQVKPYRSIFYLACSMEALSVALAPKSLFERIGFADLKKGDRWKRSGDSAIFSVLAKSCFLLSALFNLLSIVD